MNLIIFIILAVIMCLILLLDFVKIDYKLKKYFFYFIGLVFGLFCMFRSFEVPDTLNYVEYFQNIQEDVIKFGFFHIFGGFDFGYEVLNRIVAVCGFDYRILFFIVFLINFILLDKTFTTKKFVFLPLSAFMCFYGYYFNFVILRAGLATMMFCYAILKCDHLVKKIFMFLIAILFHTSIIFPIVLYIIILPFKKHIKFKTLLLLLFVLVFCYFTGIFAAILSPIIRWLISLNIDIKTWYKLLYYLNISTFNYFKVSKRFLLTIALFITTNYYINKNRKIFKNTKVYVVQRLILCGIVVSCLFGYDTMMILRLTDMLFVFNIANVVIVANSLSNSYCSTKIINNKMLKNSYCENKFFIILLLSILYIVFNVIFIYRLLLPNIVGG